MDREHYLVVGAAGGIGLEVVKSLVAQGHQVVASTRNDDETAWLREAAPGIGDIIEIDLDAPASVLARLRDTLAAMPRLDGVAVCSGISPLAPLETTPLEVIESTLRVNAVSCISIYQAALPRLRETKGRLIFISSMAGKVGMPMIGGYVGSKHALEGYADVMRREAFAWGVPVSLIEPGGVATSMGANQLKQVKARLESLSGADKTHYEPLYQAYVERLSANLPKGIAASVVAEVIIDAMTRPDPKPRYEVGADAIALCERGRTLTDQEMDEFFRQAFGAGLRPRD